jgi:hypothetical protein
MKPSIVGYRKLAQSENRFCLILDELQKKLPSWLADAAIAKRRSSLTERASTAASSSPRAVPFSRTTPFSCLHCMSDEIRLLKRLSTSLFDKQP